MNYRAMYKCRLCGNRYPCMGTGSKEIAYKTVVQLTALGYSLESLAPTMTAPHLCPSGSVGIADFQGWEKEERP